MSNTVDYLEQLENEAIYILRETAKAQFENQLCFFLGGKDSIVFGTFSFEGVSSGQISFSFGTYRHRS